MSLFRRSESRALSYQDVWGSGGTVETVAGVKSALRLIPLYAAVMGIADDVSVAPWHAYRNLGGWGERLDEQPALLTDPTGTGAGFIPWMAAGVASACLWGFAFARVTRHDRGVPVAAPWVNPSRVTVLEQGGQLRFQLDGKSVDSWLYVPGPVLPGSLKGLSPVTLFRLQLGKSLRAQRYAADLFEGGVMPPGVLRNTAQVLRPEHSEAAKARFKASVANRDIFVTGSDWEWAPLAAPADDARFLETIKAGATEIAAIYRVQPEDIGGEVSSGSLTYSTLEMNQLNRNRRALLPWVRRFEQVLSSALGEGIYVKANLDALVRSDLKARMEAHEIGLRTGVLTLDEARALEDRQPLTDEQVAQWQTLTRRIPQRTTEEAV